MTIQDEFNEFAQPCGRKMKRMNTNELRSFLVESNKAGYAGGNEKKWVKEPDGSTTIQFTRDAWSSHDNFFGGEPYGGRMVVFKDSQAVWMMMYYGWVQEGIEANKVYGVLREALMEMPEAHPYRGPREFTRGDLTYCNTWKGELGRFSGEETISQGGQIIYQATYLGGEVDKRTGV